MRKISYVGVFLSAGVHINNEKTIELYSKYLSELIDRHGSSDKNILITKQADELNLKSEKNLKIISLNTNTKGALMSLAFSLDHIENDIPVIVFPTNSKVEIDILNFLESMQIRNNDAGVICFQSNDANYSYIRVKQGKIIEFKEKEIVGDLATTGIFYFKNKHEIVNCLEWCLINNINTNGNYYLAPSLNYFVCNNMDIGLQIISSDKYSRLDIVQYIKNTQMGII